MGTHESHSAAAGGGKKDASTQVQYYTWWSNLRLEDEVAYRLENPVFPLILLERTTLIIPMQNGILNEIFEKHCIITQGPSMTVERGSGF